MERAGAWSWAGIKSKSSVWLSKKWGEPIYPLPTFGENVRLAVSAGGDLSTKLNTRRPSIASEDTPSYE